MKAEDSRNANLPKREKKKKKKKQKRKLFESKNCLTVLEIPSTVISHTHKTTIRPWDGCKLSRRFSGSQLPRWGLLSQRQVLWDTVTVETEAAPHSASQLAKQREVILEVGSKQCHCYQRTQGRMNANSIKYGVTMSQKSLLVSFNSNSTFYRKVVHKTVTIAYSFCNFPPQKEMYIKRLPTMIQFSILGVFTGSKITASGFSLCSSSNQRGQVKGSARIKQWKPLSFVVEVNSKNSMREKTKNLAVVFQIIIRWLYEVIVILMWCILESTEKSGSGSSSHLPLKDYNGHIGSPY